MNVEWQAYSPEMLNFVYCAFNAAFCSLSNTSRVIFYSLIFYYEENIVFHIVKRWKT
jgi:hypothetical protein